MGEKLDEIMAQRAQDYGSFDRQAGTIAEMWTSYLDRQGFRGTLRAADVANMMILFKMGRVANAQQFKEDTYLDIQGYAQIVLDDYTEDAS